MPFVALLIVIQYKWNIFVYTAQFTDNYCDAVSMNYMHKPMNKCAFECKNLQYKECTIL